MNKAELIEAMVAGNSDMSKKAAGEALGAVLGAIGDALAKGDNVQLIGFGTFSVGKREARAGRNPRTGEVIKIKAASTPKFKAGKALKDKVS